MYVLTFVLSFNRIDSVEYEYFLDKMYQFVLGLVNSIKLS